MISSALSCVVLGYAVMMVVLFSAIVVHSPIASLCCSEPTVVSPVWPGMTASCGNNDAAVDEKIWFSLVSCWSLLCSPCLSSPPFYQEWIPRRSGEFTDCDVGPPGFPSSILPVALPVAR